MLVGMTAQKINKTIRSFLFIPGDSEKKLAKISSIPADAVIIDLEDAVLPARKTIARQMCTDFLKSQTVSPEVWVRINPLDTEMWVSDLEAVVEHAPAGIVLPKPNGPADVETLGNKLDLLESRHKLPLGCIKILPVATETAVAVTTLNTYARSHMPRLYGLTWGAEDLAADISALKNRDENGNFSFPFDLVRAQALFAAKAAGVQAVDSLFADFKDFKGLKTYAQNSFEIGFSGMLAIHPAQVEIINRAFLPNEKQVSHARKILKAFADADGAGAVSVDGKMLDIPHKKQALNLIRLFETYSH